MVSTKQKLIRRLQQANAPDWMIHNAENGYYDDYESPIAFPITRLVADCMEYDLLDVAEEAKCGEFDGTKEESDKWLKNEGINIENRFEGK